MSANTPVDYPSYWKTYFEKQDDARMKRIIEVSNNDEFSFTLVNGGVHVLHYHPITIAENEELEALREVFAKEKDQTLIYRKLMDIYVRGAELFLKITKEEVRTLYTWESIKDVIDACQYRTVYGKPNL